MRAESLTFLEKLINTPSPPGHEAKGQRVWLDYAGQFAQETFTDAYGNAVAIYNKGGSPRIMLAGHADEIAMTVNFINKEGFIYVRKLGGVDPAITKAQRVIIHTRGGPVKGVVGNVAPHLTKGGKDRKAPIYFDMHRWLKWQFAIRNEKFPWCEHVIFHHDIGDSHRANSPLPRQSANQFKETRR